MFTNKKRTEFRKTNNISDIVGSTVGSLRKGPATKRISNPLDPDYQVPGQTEYKETNAFGMTGQQVVSGTQPISSQTQFAKKTKPSIKMPQNINRDHFKRDANQFYGAEDKNFADIDFNKLYKATKDPHTGTAPKIPEEIKRNFEFKRNEKKFFNQSQTEGSEYAYNEHQFYGGKGAGGQLTDQERTYLQNLTQAQKTQKPEPNTSTQHFKKDQAKFYGQSYVASDTGSERGSIFQNNAAEFYGEEKPTHGERPYRISTNNLQAPKNTQQNKGSVLNEMRLKEHEKNMQRDPKFGKHLRKFWGMKSQATNSQMSSSNQSYAQKLDNFLG